MPTAAKLVAAICLAALGWVASEVIRPLFPDTTVFGIFNYVNVVIGALCGWFVVGSRAGRGFSAAIANGLTGGVALVFWGLFVQATNTMVADALRRHFDTPMEAVVGIFENGLEYGQKMLDPTVIVTLLVGSVVVGIIAEVAAGRWR
jgi:hypothetical protein